MAITLRASATAFALLALTGCTAALKLATDDSASVLSKQAISAPNPADKGSYAVKQLTYGSGTDKQRREYRDGVTIKTKTVDVSPFATIPKDQVKHRKAFWGFDLKKAPINARVWYPDGAGPFPLVLIVHGNHDPEKFSDPGYAYLGEMLASRGFILASVDENFINGISEENDGRAWMLLKHLEAWKQFNETKDGPFYQRVDMTNIALMGHSRGGEAAAVAASFNTLTYYPDDFKQKFNFRFAIKAVVAIAPVDGQYKPTGQFTPLENVNYLLIHGSHDGDVSTAVGLRQYERLKFTDTTPHFKAVLFMYRANHGQWNTTWGNKDNGPRSARSLDLRGLIDPEAQRTFAKVVISGFLETSLHGRNEYVPMFRDHRDMGGWLPKTMYTTRFEESGYRPLAEFGEDVDLTTGTAPGVVVTGEHLSSWQEKAVPFRGRGTDSQNHNAAWIGWNNEMAPKPDATPKTAAAPAAKPDPKAPPKDAPKVMGPPASYSLTLPESLRSSWSIGADSTLSISLAATNTKPGLRPEDKPDKPKDEEEKPKTPAKKTPPVKKPKEPKKPKEKPDETPVDLTIELVDAAGHIARLPISRYGIARHPLEANVYIRRGRDASRFTNNYELIPQTFLMPLADFATSASDTQFDPRQLATVRLVFDKTVAGTVILEHVGITTPLKR